MPAWTHPIRPGLRPYVVSCQGYDWRLAPDAIHHGVPSLGLTLILQFDEPLDCGWSHDTPGTQFNILLAGLHSAPALIRTHGHQHGIHLTLTPWGARALFDCPAAEFAHTMVAADDLLPRHLHAQMQEASWKIRFAILDDLITRRVANAQLHHVSPGVAHAWQLIQHHQGRLAIAEVAKTVGWSRRHLSARMGTEFGLTPKELARVARFEHAHGLLSDGMPLQRRGDRRLRRPATPEPRLPSAGGHDPGPITPRLPNHPRHLGPGSSTVRA